MTEYFFEGDEYYHPRLEVGDEAKKCKVEKQLASYRINREQIEKIRSLFAEELRLGLLAAPPRPSVFPMVNTFLHRFPTGTEVGDFIGLDIGGSNLRILLLRLRKHDDGHFAKEVEIEFFNVPLDVRQSKGFMFFDFLANCLRKFVENKKLDLSRDKPPISLGFTFSFGFDQFAIDRGIVTQMGIHTSLPDVIGKDPVELFQRSIDSLNLPIRVTALANDATAVLVYARYLEPEATAGLILGSGTNVAYIEEMAKFEKISDPKKVFGDENVRQFAVNSEFPLFGDNGCMDFAKNDYDHELDRGSLTPNIYTYEKITGGAFLGELLRITLVDLVRRDLLLGGKATTKLNTSGSIETASISAIEEEFAQNNRSAICGEVVNRLLASLDYSPNDIGADDRAIVTYAGQLIMIRSAIFISAAVSVFADHIERDTVKVGCDGSVYKKYPKMARMINAYCAALCPRKRVEVFSADQGSGIGVAMIAATLAQ